MKTNKFLILVIVILVLLNVGTLSFWWITSVPRSGYAAPDERPQRIERFLRTRLELDQDQIKLFRKARQEHLAESKALMREMHATRKKILNLSKTTSEHDQVDSLLKRIADMHLQLERLNYEHMIKLRSYCNEGQQIAFDSVMLTMFEHLGNPEKHRLRKHKKYR